MDKTDMHPAGVLQALLNKGPRSQKASNLNALDAICAKQHAIQARVVRDFSIATIGRLCEQAGIFKARVLYNAASEDYVALIKAWAAYSGSASTKAPKRDSKLPSAHPYLMRIEDPAIRTIMQSIIAERDKLKNQLAIMKSQSQIVVNQRSLGVVVPKKQDFTILEAKSQLTDSERTSLEKAISTAFLVDQGWQFGADGEIVNEIGRVIYDPGYESAIRKVMG